MFDPIAVPGFFQIIIAYPALSANLSLGIRLKTTAGEVYSISNASGIALPELFNVQLLNPGWAAARPLAGPNLFTLSRVDLAPGEALTPAVPADRILTIEACCNTSAGQSNLRLFGYGVPSN
jgi:hypothetical protein